MGWKPETEKMDYIFQHKYRSKSIDFFYKKDMLTCFLLCVFSIIIQYSFLETFKGARQDNYGNDGKFVVMSEK